MSKKFLLLSVSLVFIFVGTVNSNSIEPDIFVQSTVNRASEALNNNFSKDCCKDNQSNYYNRNGCVCATTR